MKGTNVAWLVMLGFVILGVAIYAGVSSLDITGTSALDEQGDPVVTCDSTTTPSLTIKGIDRDNPGTALTESTNLYREEGQTGWSNFTQGSSFSATPGNTLEIVMGITTSDQTDNAYGEKFTYKVPCEENPSIEKELAQDEVETDLSATFYNADGDASAESFSADESQTVSVKLKADPDEYFGNPNLDNPNIICMDLNKTTWDNPEQLYVEGGDDLNAVGTPQRHDSVSGKTTYCYELPVITDKEAQIKMSLNADASNAPAADETASIYAGGYFINSNIGDVEIGVEDEEGNAVGTDAADTVTLDFT